MALRLTAGQIAQPAPDGIRHPSRNTTNMKAQHTPGPWHINTMETVQATIHAHRGHVATVSRGSMNEVSADEIEANARLIAAAPDLLAALEQCLPILDAHRRAALGEGDLTARTARAAIAKARDTQ